VKSRGGITAVQIWVFDYIKVSDALTGGICTTGELNTSQTMEKVLMELSLGTLGCEIGPYDHQTGIMG
jgi:hypothetical protein